MSPNTNDIVYLAGIVDGEGSIIIYKHVRKGSRKVDYGGYLTVTNTDKRLILWLCTTFGGNWCMHAKATSTRKECLRWNLYGREALMLIMQLRPYLKLKQKQADVFIRFYSSLIERRDRQAGLPVGEACERDYLIAELHKLNKGGDMSA